MTRRRTNVLVRKAREAVRIYRYGNLMALFPASLRFVQRQVMKPWHLTGDEIYARCSRQIPVQSPERKIISYDGRFRDSLPQRLADIEGEIRTPERVIAEYEDAYVLGSGMIVRVDRGYIVPMEVGSERRYSPRLASNVSLVEALYDYIDGDRHTNELDGAFLLTGERGLPFAHWFYETLPKLRWYERYCRVIGQEPPLIVPSELTDWQRESLALMGYSADSWVEQGSGPTRVNKLAISPHDYRNRGSRFTGSPATLRWVRNRILSNVSESNRAFPNRVYVSRADADRRRVRNEDELISSLQQLGFVNYTLSDLPFEDQVRLFAGADVVVGTHGAGLTNIIYSTDIDVVDLFTSEGASEHFFVLANELNHSYDFVLCDPADDDHNPPRHKDMFVGPKSVQDVIADL